MAGRYRVLLIDDDEADRMVIARSLRGACPGVTVMEAGNGEEGLERIAADDPDLVLLDLRMPGFDGFDVLSRVRSGAGSEALPVIVLSTSDTRQDVHRAYSLHANAYLQKPGSMAAYDELARNLVRFWFETAVLR